MNKILQIIFLSFLVTSCEFGTKQLPSQDQLLQEELNKIDWSKVDTYPSTSQCDSVQGNQEQKDCFFAYITTQLQERLYADTLKGRFTHIDTVKVLVTVQANSTVKFKLYETPDSLYTQSISIDSLLKSKEKDFPTILPATKRGIPVTSEFIIPVVLIKQ
ncbi:hypothetical protein [Myroides injenensis]|uniref:hypothetical protein n=1 Tax=Myroides injenensis TaxID=1183151 RepID=UPI0022706EFF|nr:hypothetical protein [Myroides injenensis]